MPIRMCSPWATARALLWGPEWAVMALLVGARAFSGSAAASWWVCWTVIATAVTAFRCQWWLDRRTRAQRAATLSMLSAATASLALVATGPVPPSLETLLVGGAFVAGAAAVTWSMQLAVPKLPVHAYLLLLLIVPGILDLSTGSVASSLSPSELRSENVDVRWFNLSPWFAVALVVALGHRREAAR